MGALKTQELTINMGPQHPSTHGVLRIELVTDGEICERAIPHIGYLHRCFEKHAESIDYMGVMPFVDRMDYVASMNNDMAYAMTVEKLLGAEVPKRAEYIRVIMAELNRIASHLLAIGTYGLDIGTFTPFMWAFRDREKVVRGIKKKDSVIIDGYQLYHNYIREHMALNGKTPADKAGIIIEGNNKWKTIIENAKFSLSDDPSSASMVNSVR